MKTWMLAAALTVLAGAVSAETGAALTPDQPERAALLRDIELHRDALLPVSEPPHPITAKYAPLLDKIKAAAQAAQTPQAAASAKKGFEDWKREVLAKLYAGGYRPGQKGETLAQFQERMAGEVAALSLVRQIYASQRVENQIVNFLDLSKSQAQSGYAELFDNARRTASTSFSPSAPFSPFQPSNAGVSDGSVRADMPAANDPARYDKIRALLLSKGVDKRVIDAAISEGLRQKVDPMIVLSVIDQESNFKRTAYNKGSGCTGLMQLDPATANDMGVKDASLLYDVKTNIRAGVKYLDWIANKFFKMNLDMSSMASVPADKLKMVLASYNWGIGNVQKAVKKHGPAALDRVAPKETRNYIAEIPGRIRDWFASLYS